MTKFDFETLTQEWQTQNTDNVAPDIAIIERRAKWHRIKIAAMSVSEVIVLVMCGYFLWLSVANSWSVVSQLWLLFGVVSGLWFFIPLMKSRYADYQTTSIATIDKLDMEIALSHQAVARCRLGLQLISVFAIGTLGLLAFELLAQDSTLSSLGLRYGFAFSWLGLFTWLTIRVMGSHRGFLDKVN